MVRWGADQVLALAPDTSSAKAARGLASPAPWSETGWHTGEPPALWGLCAGSGKSPYAVSVDLSGPAYRCSCPSRKFPCKHALGLLLLWSAGAVVEADPPERVTEWLGGRSQRAERSATRATTQSADPAAAARRAQQRAERMAGGLDELRRWLADQIEAGLAQARAGGYARVDQLAARMVDAQLPGVAAAVRRAGSTAAAPGAEWPPRLLAELGMLFLLIRAHDRIGELPDGLAATVRQHLGLPVAGADVLAGPAIRDIWQVVGSRDSAEDNRLAARRIWLRGTASGRMALSLSFAPAGGALEASLVPGTQLDADLHFYPGDTPLRAIVGERHAEPTDLAPLSGGGLRDALRAWSAALAADPWTRAWPVVVNVAVVVRDGGWFAVDPSGAALPFAGPPSWTLRACSAGRALPVVAELGADGLWPVSTWYDGRLVTL